MTDTHIAKLMWDAYAIQAGWDSFDGKPLPAWDELSEDRQSCWVAAASVTADRIEKLEAALTPFLKLPIGVINDDPPEMEVYQCHGWPRDQLAVVTVADFRRVRKALEGKDG